MKHMRWAIVAAAACYAAFSPGLSMAQTWNQINGALVCTECAPPYNLLAVTNIPSKTTTGVVQDNIDVYAQWDPGQSVRVASCGPAVTTSTCPKFSTGWVPIPIIAAAGRLPSAVGWGTTPSTAHREVFISDEMGGISHATRDGANANAWVAQPSLGSPPAGICSGPQAISQAKGMISVVVVGCDHNLWNNFFQNGQWSPQWINVTAGTELDSNILGDSGNSDFALSVVYDNFSVSGTSAYKQIHVIVSDLFNAIWDINYVFDASKNYNPGDPNSWQEDSNLTMNTGGETTAAVSPLRKIAMFGNGADLSSPFGPQPLYGQSFTEQLDSFPTVPPNPTPETVNGGLNVSFNNGDNVFRATPAAVTFGKPGGSCSTFPACRNGVFFINSAQNIQYSIWEGSSWNTSVGVRTIGGAGDTFTANPVAVVSMQGTKAGKLAYVFAVREVDTATTEPGQVWFATVVP